MKVLALDLSTRAGWACAEPWGAGLPIMEVGSFRVPEGTHQERFESLYRQIDEFCVRQHVDLAIVETPQIGVHVRKELVSDGMGGQFLDARAQGSVTTQTLLWGFRATLAALTVVRGIPVHDVGVREWRKSIFGNGNIPGQEAKKRSKETLQKFGVDVRNQDEAEAGMILVWAMNRLPRILAELQLKKTAA